MLELLRRSDFAAAFVELQELSLPQIVPTPDGANGGSLPLATTNFKDALLYTKL